MIPTTLRETVTEAMEMADAEARIPWFIDTERRAKLLDLLDLQLRRAETAEAYAAWVVDVPPQATTLDIYATGERLLSEYKAARERVRTLEDQPDGS